ncbi:Na+/H+ antiporter subunit G [Yoonia sp.]|uniref:Na+/H+ antiporter subunit G n=1 Tax=Yoonia sp. TaxID=2212373 RepID=UPI0019F296BE|nr:Na+/H+ antiporter subunit G [Yoonia sp.]MBE0414116.1 Na+/H+ antiporter subunit G [Yoonia sp.]
MIFLAELLVALSLIVSGIFGFVGSFGLVKLRHTTQRLHAPTKATTLGVGGVLIASIAYTLVDRGELSLHELMITLFLFLTAPITAHFIMKTYVAQNLRESDLPDSKSATGWSIYDDPPSKAPDS